MQGILGSKMAMEKDKLLDWISKLVARKKVGALLLSVVFLAMFIFALLVRKEGEYVFQAKGYLDLVLNLGVTANNMALSSPQSSQTFGEQTKNTASSPNILGVNPNMVLPPPLIAAVSLGYTLSPDHPGSNFTLPIPHLPVCYLPVEKAIAMMPKVPSHSSVLKKLTYIYEQNLSRKTEFGGSDFGGYPTLKQRVDSYDIKESISVHCGFVIGVKPGTNTGFDIEDDDLRDMEQCGGVVVASAIFDKSILAGNFEEINQPRYISEYSMKTVCFYMFVDEETEAYMKASVALGSSKKNGLWRIVVVHNLPYEDPWRNGRIPKLLLHRIFPNARFSLWIDGKLQLIRDPYQILERYV
ncbi:hypothetical protein FEM48_Zijuj01G0154600 [Ziziphus jujuba var. spinosa]|uniref:TOD1/MUCI70 glycosyltransferase-like domain-containing protein n=1 Tax=Ziziphus jujuba var. spinosa TaxID=714518 RepID=A0A978W217_ZIZJJ|nr:hypothetical protein FEM48_Zijuj01G0154600 [Ziziphus jujuba var. spinosa]